MSDYSDEESQERLEEQDIYPSESQPSSILSQEDSPFLQKSKQIDIKFNQNSVLFSQRHGFNLNLNIQKVQKKVKEEEYRSKQEDEFGDETLKKKKAKDMYRQSLHLGYHERYASPLDKQLKEACRHDHKEPPKKSPAAKGRKKSHRKSKLTWNLD